MHETIRDICTVLCGIAALEGFILKSVDLAKKRFRLPHFQKSPLHEHSGEDRMNIADLSNNATEGSTLATPTFTTIYRVWTSPYLTKYVKVGWSWPAYLFGALWALTKGMPLYAGAAALVGYAVVYAFTSAKTSDADGFTILFAASQLLGLLFGMYGNTLIERNLTKRGFLLRNTILRIHPVYGFLAAGLRAIWTNKRLRAVSVGIILAVSTTIGAYFLYRSYAEFDPRKVQLVRNCDKAVINGTAIPNGSESLAWFEWGDAPELGRYTTKQRFTETTNFYQHLAGLKENTTYYYKVVVVNAYGRTDSRVGVFKTPHCAK